MDAVTSYQSPGGYLSDRWTKISEKEGGGYLSDNCGLEICTNWQR